VIENDYTENDYYVSFDAVFRAIDEYDDYVIDDETGEWYIPISKALSLIENVPPADVCSVVKAKWIDYNPQDILDPRMKCSNCGVVAMPLAEDNFCPKCGAKME
jgi:hypothetical protein